METLFIFPLLDAHVWIMDGCDVERRWAVFVGVQHVPCPPVLRIITNNIVPATIPNCLGVLKAMPEHVFARFVASRRVFGCHGVGTSVIRVVYWGETFGLKVKIKRAINICANKISRACFFKQSFFFLGQRMALTVGRNHRQHESTLYCI